MSIPNATFTKWVQAQQADLTELGPILQYELIHTMEGGAPERLQIFKNVVDTDPDTLSQTIWEVAENDVSTRLSGQPQRYVCYAFRQGPEPEASHPFLIRNRNNYLRGEDSEPGTERGTIAHYLRHDENMHRSLMNMMDVVGGRLVREIERSETKRLELEKNQFSVMEKMQELLDRSHERDLERAEATEAARRMDKILDMAMALMPVVGTALVQKLSGSKVVPPVLGDGNPMRDTGIGKLMESLSFEELQGIMEVLSPENRLVVMQYYQEYKKESEARERDKPEVFRNGKEEKH